MLGSSRNVPAGASDLEVILHAVSWLPIYVAQAIGAMGWLETRPPLLTYLIWGLLLLVVSITALRFGSQRMRSVLLAFGTVCLVVPTLITASQARALKSIVWEGKDGMPPLWVGLPILAVGASATWWSEHPQMGRGLIAAAGVAQFAAFVGPPSLYSTTRGPWTMMSDATDSWSPPLPALVLVGLYAAVLVLGWRMLVYRPVGARGIDLIVHPKKVKAHNLVRRPGSEHLSSSGPKDEPVNW